MPTIAIRFPGGHYHATPWGSHANEGAVEWPPSPWRLLRALISTGYTKLPEWQDGVMPESARSLFAKLAAVLPSYRLPGALGMHTRHYMPTAANPTLVLDARAVVAPDDALLVQWAAEFDGQEAALFRDLVERLGCLGRAEAWTDAAVLDDPPPVGPGWVRPCASSELPGRDWEQTAVLAPLPVDVYARWRETEVAKALTECPLPDGKRPPSGVLKKRAKLAEPYPTDLLACLQVETGWLQRLGWSQPPGSQRVLYWRPAHAIAVAEPARPVHAARPAVPFVLLALASSARSRSVLPRAERALPQAELLHRTLASLIRGGADGLELIGVDVLGKCLQGHRHAHLLPLCLHKDDGHLDHVLVWAPDGLSDTAQTVLRRVRKTYMKGGVGDLCVRYAGGGAAPDMLALPELRRFLGTSRTWQSVTPLVLPRFRKRSGKNCPEGQLRAELDARGFPAPITIEWLRDTSVAMRHFVRRRRDRQPPPEDYGYALRLTFAEPISGPLCLGYASHFGLGLFAVAPPA